MPGRRFSGFDIRAGVIALIAIVAVSTCVWLTTQMKPASQQTAGSLQGATAPSVQPEGLRDPLPQVITECKQETPMTFAAKKKGVFVPDWPIRPREDKKDVNGSVEITDFVPETLSPVPTTQPVADEDFLEDTERQSVSEISHREDAGSEDSSEDAESQGVSKEPESEGILGDAGSEGIVPETEGIPEEVEKTHIVTEDVPPEPKPRETETAVEWQTNGDTVGGDEAGEQEVKPTVDPPRLFVSGIIVSDDASYAIVKTSTSSVIVQPGDEIEGATVKSVEEKAVVVVKQNEEFVLELGGGGES